LNALLNLRRNSGLLLFVAAQILFFGANISVWLTGPTVVVSSIGIVPGVWAVAEWIAAVRRSGRGGPAGPLFAASAISYFLGVSAYEVLDLLDIETKYPSFADLCFLLLPMFLVGGLFWLRPPGQRHGYGGLQAANLGLVAAAAGILAAVSIAPLLAGSGDSFMYLATTVGYWVVSFAGAAFLLLALLGFEWREKKTLVILLAATLAIFLAGSIPYTYDLIRHAYSSGAWYEVFWYASPCVLALAGREFRRIGQSDGSNVQMSSLRAMRIVPTAIMAGTICVLGWSVGQTFKGVTGGFIICAAAAAAAAMAMREWAVKHIEDALEARLQSALDEAHDNEGRFRDFAESASDFFLETDKDFVVRKVIHASDRDLVAPVNSIVGRHLFSPDFAGHREYHPPLDVVLQAMMDRQVVRDGEYTYTPAGGEQTCRYSGVPYYDSQNQFLGYRFSLQNVTSQKTLERDNARRKAELERVVRALDSALEVIFTLDARDCVTYMNAAADNFRIHTGGFNPVGRYYAEVFPRFYRQHPGIFTEIKRGLADAGMWAQEIVIDKESQRHTFDLRVSALPDGGMLFAATDITDRKQREADEVSLREKLAEAQKTEAIGKIASGVAHDFNNIIGAIQSFARLIVYDLPSDSPDRKYAERIVTSTERASELVRQILLFARAGSADHEAVSLRTILDELQDMFVSTISDQVSFTVKLPEDDAVIKGNSAQLLQVLMNLGVNAVDAVIASAGKVEISCESVVLSRAVTDDLRQDVKPASASPRYVSGPLVPGRRYVRVTVADTGSGIPENLMPRIFEPFFTTKEKIRGTGLGLAVVNSIVAAHDGIIVMTTARGRGTRFQLYFSAADGAPRDDGAAIDLGAVGGPERVLIVDDEVDLADGLSLALQKLGYETASVYGSEEALDVFSKDPRAWDIVITDQVMPRMTGLQLTSKMKQLNANVDIVLCTGFSDSATEQNSKRAGAGAFLQKPSSPELIAQTIRRLRSEREGRRIQQGLAAAGITPRLPG
jgi:signal transduction histidine kinase/CheY-like chemotaxis protein